MKLEFYMDDSGGVLALDWFGDVPERVRDKFAARLERWKRMARLPATAELEAGPDNLFALRVRDRGLAYRLFLFFHGSRAVLSHGCVEERDQRGDEWRWLKLRRADYQRAPLSHAYVLGPKKAVGTGSDAGAPLTSETRDALTILELLYPRLTPAQVHGLGDAREEARLARGFAKSRLRAGLSRAELARRLGVCVSTIRGLEEGDSEGYSLSFLRRAALMLDVRLHTRLDSAPRLVTSAS